MFDATTLAQIESPPSILNGVDRRVAMLISHDLLETIDAYVPSQSEFSNV